MTDDANDSDEFLPFLLSYDLDGRRYGLTIMARDWPEAQAHAIRLGARVDGIKLVGGRECP